MGMIEKMMEYMLGRISEKEKEEIMNKMMDKFFAGMTVESESIYTDKFKVPHRVCSFVNDGGEIFTCGTCLKIR